GSLSSCGFCGTEHAQLSEIRSARDVFQGPVGNDADAESQLLHALRNNVATKPSAHNPVIGGRPFAEQRPIARDRRDRGERSGGNDPYVPPVAESLQPRWPWQPELSSAPDHVHAFVTALPHKHPIAECLGCRSERSLLRLFF